MRFIRLVTVLIFLISIGAYTYLSTEYQKNLDETAPVFTMDRDAVKLSVTAGN